MRNPKPNTSGLQPFKKHDRALAEKSIGTRYTVEAYAALQAMENRVEYIRQAVEEKLIADGLL